PFVGFRSGAMSAAMPAQEVGASTRSVGAPSTVCIEAVMGPWPNAVFFPALPALFSTPGRRKTEGEDRAIRLDRPPGKRSRRASGSSLSALRLLRTLLWRPCLELHRILRLGHLRLDPVLDEDAVP